MTTCSTHPDQPASHRCERGCGKALCGDCIQRGHRLLMCRHCGELAVPLDIPGPVVGEAVRPVFGRRADAEAWARAQPYGFVDALGYPLRGDGGKSFWVLLALFALTDVVSLVMPLAAIPLSLFLGAVGFLVPGLLAAIARTTAAGENELPDWPDWDPWDRLYDALAFGFGWILCALPTVALLKLGGFGWDSLDSPESARTLFLVLTLGFLIGAVLAVVVLGAPAVYDQRSAVLRLDLHLMALAVAPLEAVRIGGAVAVLLLASTALRFVLIVVPLLGSLASTAVGLYALYLAAHLIGLYFRRHGERLDRLYLGRGR